MNNVLNVNEIIKVTALPKIYSQLEIVGKEIDKELAKVNKLQVTEEAKQEAKNIRANINKTLQVFEERRKEIKNEILKDYDLFNQKYEIEVKSKLIEANNLLGNKISEIENAQKQEKTNMLIEFANKQFDANEIQGIVKFEDIGLNITLSASEKSLKEQIVNFCERVRNDLDTILLEELKDEILVEYKKCLNYTQAKQIVLQRYKELELAKEQSEKLNNVKQEEIKIQNAVYEVVNDTNDEIKAPQEINSTTLSDIDEMLVVTFTIRETREKLRLLKQFMVDNDIKYE